MLLLPLLTIAAKAAGIPNYSCPATCVLPACRCASLGPPLPIAETPQFILISFDDAIQSGLMPQVKRLLDGRRNPNGCAIRATWYTQVLNSDPILVNQWYAAGHEIDSYAEIEGMRAWASTFGGIPRGRITGVRFPYRSYTPANLAMLAKMGVEYDSSIASTSSDDLTWPYTLDYGVVNECLGSNPVCGDSVRAAGLWEVPMYTINDGLRTYLMDPYNDPSLDKPITPEQVTRAYTNTFDERYGGSRTPMGIYTHPVWLGAAISSSIPDGSGKLDAVVTFLEYALSKPDVWVVTPQQLIAYMKNPVSKSQLGSQSYMQCPAPPSGICNGIGGGVRSCGLSTGAFSTCYNCPSVSPSLENPTPQSSSDRKMFPDTCDSLYWDPVVGRCLCDSDTCKWNDNSRPINLDPASLDQTTENDGRVSEKGRGNGALGQSMMGLGLVVMISIITGHVL